MYVAPFSVTDSWIGKALKGTGGTRRTGEWSSWGRNHSSLQEANGSTLILLWNWGSQWIWTHFTVKWGRYGGGPQDTLGRVSVDLGDWGGGWMSFGGTWASVVIPALPLITSDPWTGIFPLCFSFLIGRMETVHLPRWPAMKTVWSQER